MLVFDLENSEINKTGHLLPTYAASSIHICFSI